MHKYACAEEAAYHTETKYSLLADVRDQLDEDEIVSAYDVVIDMGDYFNPADVSAFKVDKTNQPTDKVDVSFFSAHATDGTAFTSDMPGSYFAYYIAKPVNGHPAYEVSRRITVNAVEEPTAPVVPETVEAFPEDEPADEDSEDDPYEESKIDDYEEAAFDDEGESEEEYDDAEEFPEGDEDSEEDDSWDNYAEDEESDWEEESDADGDADPADDDYPGEYDDDEYPDEDLTSGDWDEADDDFADEDYDYTDPDEDYYDDPEEDDFDDEGEDDPIDESDVEDESVDDPADEDDASDDEDEDGEEAVTTPEASPDPTFDMPQIYDEPIETLAPVESLEPTEVIVEETPVDTPEDDEDVPGDDGDDASGDDGEATEGTDEEPSPEDEVEATEAFTLPVDQILTTLLEPTLSLASVDGSEGDDDATEEDDDMEEIDPDNIVLEGDAKMVRGSKVTYPSSLGSWSTFKYTVNGKMAYCLESSKTSPKGGSFAQEILDSNPNLTKTLYYGYGGPEDLSASFFPDYSANVCYILTHIATSY